MSGKRVADEVGLPGGVDIVESQVLGYILGGGHAESGMCLAQRYKPLIVLELIMVRTLQFPVYGVYVIRTPVRVVNALLVSENLLSCEHERSAL